MRENLKMDRCMEKEHFIIIQANLLMMECGLKISFMVKASFIMNAQSCSKDLLILKISKMWMNTGLNMKVKIELYRLIP